ncbi:probable G-protein coupled receptor 21 [Diadema setosum]|uniref:probable G-protein coupled receptor 21 n=1 Tax=Diadema setosum TaxID=31175 RepID=UPI003B3ABCE5
MDVVTPTCARCGLLDQEQEGTADSCSPSLPFSLLFVVCGLVTIFSNVVNLLALNFAQHCFSENTRLCFQAVAVIDFFVGLFCCTFHSIRFSGLSIATTRAFSITGVIFCSTLFNQSVMILACVSVDRYLAITRPLRYHTIVTRRRMIALILCGVLIGTINSASSLAHKILANVKDLKFASVEIAHNPVLIVYFALIVISAGVTTFCNIVLVKLARRHRRRIFAQTAAHGKTSNALPPVQQPRSNKDVRTVLAVTGAFYVTWGAQVSVNFVSAVTGVEIHCIVRNVLLILVISNSFWNALIYLLINSTFRRTVILMFTRGRTMLPNRTASFALPVVTET